MPKITKRAVDALKPREREFVFWDDEITGFGVRVRPTGRKVYIVKFRDRGRAVKVTIGPHGAVTPAAARARAAEILTAARTGKDPSGQPLWNARTDTVAQLARRFLEDYVPDHCKPNTRRQYRKMVEGHIVPRLGARRVHDIRRIDIAAVHHDLRATPPTANRVLATCSRMFALAEIWGMRPENSNPCRGIRHFREKPRERFLSDVEYRRLGEVLREVEREGSERPSAVAAIRLLMLTGCRKSEILTLRWEHVDLERGELRLPDSKSGAKIVHLGEPAIAVLKGISREDGNPWVIAGVRPGTALSDVYDQWHRIRRRAGIEDVRIHDLRHSFASGGLLVGEGLTMIGKLLGHNKVETTSRYAHLANDPLKAAANRIASRIAEVAG
ncbi:MAG: tyrosine-type recombinase/integrase [Gammaproteobacteria bacterium]|nr:tyrosine-type recombinase/integrase [Gammaproteobacteria bacterium]